MNPSKIF